MRPVEHQRRDAGVGSAAVAHGVCQDSAHLAIACLRALGVIFGRGEHTLEVSVDMVRV